MQKLAEELQLSKLSKTSALDVGSECDMIAAEVAAVKDANAAHAAEMMAETLEFPHDAKLAEAQAGTSSLEPACAEALEPSCCTAEAELTTAQEQERAASGSGVEFHGPAPVMQATSVNEASRTGKADQTLRAADAEEVQNVATSAALIELQESRLFDADVSDVALVTAGASEARDIHELQGLQVTKAKGMEGEDAAAVPVAVQAAERADSTDTAKGMNVDELADAAKDTRAMDAETVVSASDALESVRAHDESRGPLELSGTVAEEASQPERADDTEPDLGVLQAVGGADLGKEPLPAELEQLLGCQEGLEAGKATGHVEPCATAQLKEVEPLQETELDTAEPGSPPETAEALGTEPCSTLPTPERIDSTR